ncbi:MAG: ribosome maturation factor RimM [Oscillospiraceae bacterium]|nr:ribosome maturation factor RimM [Oscillospiraceae bacterium]
MSEFIEAGKIISAHSFKGEVKIQSWCDSAEFLTRFKVFYLDGNGENCLNINKIRVSNEKEKLLIVSFDEIDSEEKAVMLRNKVIYIKKQDANLSEGTFFISDLTGLPVFDFDDKNKKYGVLSDIFHNGASDVYVITTDKKDKNNKDVDVLIPNVPAFIKKINLIDGIFITPIEGMFDE